MGWSMYEFHDSIQVIPIDDLKPHSLFHCECHPRFEDGIFIHNSFDSRELLETPLRS